MEAKEYYTKCEKCNGDGFTSEHDPSDPHHNGECNSCPIQVQCEPCRASGFVLTDFANQSKEADLKKFVRFLKGEGILLEDEGKPQDLDFLYDVWSGKNPDGLL